MWFSEPWGMSSDLQGYLLECALQIIYTWDILLYIQSCMLYIKIGKEIKVSE